MTNWEQLNETEEKQLVDALINIASRRSCNKVVELLSREHRTHQQSVTHLMLKWLKHLSTLNENQYDARNEASVRVAKIMMRALDDEGLIPHLPFI